MLKPVYLRSFEREIAKVKKRGLDMSKIKVLIEDLISEKPLAAKHKNHKLKGNFIGYWECHIEPDWLLVYKKDDKHIYFARTGTHSDLF
jgi:mRNA interferase YafQ